MPEQVRTLCWDDGWFTVVAAGVVGRPEDDAWRGIERGRRTAQQLRLPHVVELPNEVLVERPEELARVDRRPPWAARPEDEHAEERALVAATLAGQADARLAALSSDPAASRVELRAATVASKEARRHATAARARAADALERSAEAHESAALVHDHLACRARDPELHRDRAAFHRRAADADWRRSRSAR